MFVFNIGHSRLVKMWPLFEKLKQAFFSKGNFRKIKYFWNVELVIVFNQLTIGSIYFFLRVFSLSASLTNQIM